jgi:hypothetical protein
MIDRALLVIMIMGMALDHAAAQFGGAPGTLPDASPVPSPAPRPPQCDALLAIRDEWQKHGQAIKAANQKKADVRGACKLFRAYLNTEMKMLRMLEADGASCGVPPQVLQQVRGSHAKAQRIGQQICDAAQRSPYWYPLDEDIIRPFKLDPEPRPKPWPKAYTARPIDSRK